MTEETTTPAVEAESSDVSQEITEQVTTEQDGGLIDSVDTKQDALTDVPAHEVAPNEDLGFDKRLYTDDGKFNKDGAKEFFAEQKTEKDKYEKRILDLRRTVSSGKAPESKDAYFQDFAPDEKYMTLFDEGADNSETIDQVKDVFSTVYHEIGLNKKQADSISHAVLALMEDTNVIDTRTQEEKYIHEKKWIDEQKEALGPNADNIIREARTFIDSAPIFSAEVKNKLLETMNKVGAPFVDAIYQIKDAYGGGAGSVPTNISSLGNLPSDVELATEYMNPETSDLRRQEIHALRERSGRTERLMAAINR